MSGASKAAPSANPEPAQIARLLRDAVFPVPLHTSPLLTALGAELVGHDPAAAAVRLRFLPDAVFLQGAEVVQGGAVSAMLDFAMAIAVMASTNGETPIATTGLTVQFLRAVPAAQLTATGTVVRRGRRIAFAQAELADSGGSLVATASSTLVIG